MSTYRTVDGQNIYDVAINTYGKPEEAVRLMIENDNLSDLNSDLIGGTELEFTEEPNTVTQFFIDKKITIATNDDKEVERKGFDDGFDQGFN